jgi:hypothetical protein
MLVQAFGFQTYSKIPEFIEFKHRLTNSVQGAVTRLHRFRSELLYNCSSLKDFDLELFSALSKLSIGQFRDNRDSKVIPQWNETSLLDLLYGYKFPNNQDEFISTYVNTFLALKAWKASDTTLLKESLQQLMPDSLLHKFTNMIIEINDCILDKGKREIGRRIDKSYCSFGLA